MCSCTCLVFFMPRGAVWLQHYLSTLSLATILTSFQLLHPAFLLSDSAVLRPVVLESTRIASYSLASGQSCGFTASLLPSQASSYATE